MATGSTSSTTVVVDLPDVPSGSVIFKLMGLGVNAALEAFPSVDTYIFNLSANGEDSDTLPTPDATGDASWTWHVTKYTGQDGEGNATFLGEIVLGYSASAQELGTLLQAADTAVDPSLVGILAATSTWLTAEKTATEAATDGNLLQGDGTNSEDSGITSASVSGHIASTSNPHSVTAVQVDALPIDAGIVAVNGARDLATTDNGKILECTGTFALNCPNGLDAGFQVALVNVGSGTITITATTTLQSKDSAVTLDTQYAAATLYHRGSNVWLLAGDIA